MSENPMFMYAAEYESVGEAKADLEELKELHRDKLVGTYDAAVLTKNEEGKVKIVDKTEKPTQHGGWAGLAAGAAIGLIFPPSILVSGLVGAGAGALIGHLQGGMSDSDLKEIGELLDESEAALIVIGEETIERGVEKATRRAKKEMKKEVRCQEDPGSLLGPVARRNRPGRIERRPSRGGEGDDAASPRLAVVATRYTPEG